MMDFEVQAEADTQAVEEMLFRVRDRVMDYRLTRFLERKAVPFVRDRINRRFADEGDDVVGRWAPLRPSTENIRRRQGFGARHPINVRTGRLFRFVKTSRVNGTTLTMPGLRPDPILRSKLTVAQIGGYPPIGRMGRPAPAPPRPVLGLNDNDRIGIETRLMQWVREGAK